MASSCRLPARQGLRSIMSSRLEKPRGELPVCAAVNTHTDELDMFHQPEPKSSRLRLSHKCETTSESESETPGDDSKATRQSLNGDLYYEAAIAEQLGSCMKPNPATSCQTYVAMLLQGSPKQKRYSSRCAKEYDLYTKLPCERSGGSRCYSCTYIHATRI